MAAPELESGVGGGVALGPEPGVADELEPEVEEESGLGVAAAPDLSEVGCWLVDDVLELGVDDVDALESEPDDEPELLAPLELCAKLGIATKARLLEQRREISCREGFMTIFGLS